MCYNLSKGGSMKIVEVNKENYKIAIKLQEEIFPKDKSPEQIITGIKTKNPINYVCYKNDKPVGIFGFYYYESMPDHILLNWYGVLKEYRRLGYGKEIILTAIEYAKQTGKKYLTFWTEKEDCKEAIQLYKKVDFDVRDYCCKEDVEKLKRIGEDPSRYAIGVYSLTDDNEEVDFSKLDMQISKQLEILSEFNK